MHISRLISVGVVLSFGCVPGQVGNDQPNGAGPAATEVVGGASPGTTGEVQPATTGAAPTPPTTGAAPTPPIQDTPAPLPAGDAVSPAYLGIQVDNCEPGSNTPLFLQHLGVNEVRQFVTLVPSSSTLQKFMGASFGRDASGRPVTTAKEFVAAAAALAATTNPFTLPASTKFVLSELQRLHITYLAQVRVDTSSFDFSTYNTESSVYWQEHFGFYTYMYYFSRLLMQNQVTYFETHNEPDIELPSVQSTVDHILLTSQAVRAAAHDDPNQPQVKILGPVLANTGVPITGSSWLPPILERMRTTIPAGQGNVPAIDLVSYHRYGRDGAYTASLAEAYGAEVAAKGFSLPLAITEYSTSTTRGLDTEPLSSDDPPYASNFLSQTLGVLGKMPFISAYVFSMSSAPNFHSGVHKNGVHWVDFSSTSPLNNVGGPTRSGEAFAFVGRHFGGSKPMYSIPGTTDWVTTADAHHVYILSVNNTSSAVTKHGLLTALPSALKVAPNTPCFIDGVSANSYGQVAETTKLDANSKLTFTQPAYSTWLVTIPRESSGASLTSLAVQHDNVIKAGSDVATFNQGTLRVAAAHQVVEDTSAAVLQFSPNVQPASWVGLRLTVAASDSADVILHVYGFTRIGADAEHLTWGNSGLMKQVNQDTQVSSIVDNLLNYQSSPSPAYLGSLFVPASSKNLPITLNVTDFANASIGTGPTVYVIVREFLNNGTLNLMPGPDVLSGTAVTFAGASADDKSQRPVLQVQPY